MRGDAHDEPPAQAGASDDTTPRAQHAAPAGPDAGADPRLDADRQRADGPAAGADERLRPAGDDPADGPRRHALETASAGTDERMEQVKRRVYPMALGLAAVAAVVVWLVLDQDSLMVSYGYPALAAVLAVGLVALWRRWVSLGVLEQFTVALTAVFFQVRLAEAAITAEQPITALADEVTVIVFWLTIICIGVFVVFERRRALGLSLAMLAITVVTLVTATVLDHIVFGEADLLLVVRSPFSMAVGIGLLTTMAYVKDELRSSTGEAVRLAEQAGSDALTGLANRRLGQRLLDQLVDQSTRYERPLSVLSVDIDHFKPINDTYGHDRGDEVLRAVADRLQTSTRAADVVIRWGGEEFLVVCPETVFDDAVDLAERCRQAVGSEHPTGLPVTISVGVGTHVPGETADEMLVRVDEALYETKEGGRNRVVATGQVSGTG